MEGLNEDKRGVIGTPLYPNLTIEKLREVLNEILSKPREPQMNLVDMMKYQSPEVQEAFHKALMESANNWTMDKHQIEAIEALEANSYVDNFTKKEPIEGTGKTRKKNTHLTPKKKKRKR